LRSEREKPRKWQEKKESRKAGSCCLLRYWVDNEGVLKQLCRRWPLKVVKDEGPVEEVLRFGSDVWWVLGPAQGTDAEHNLGNN
jgi:hypothetical protein